MLDIMFLRDVEWDDFYEGGKNLTSDEENGQPKSKTAKLAWRFKTFEEELRQNRTSSREAGCQDCQSQCPAGTEENDI